MHLPDRLTNRQIREKTEQLGIADFGVVVAGDSESCSTFTDWIDCGYCASMNWLVKNAPARQHPRFVFPVVQTLLVVAVSLAELPVRQELASPAIVESGDNVNSNGIGLIIPYSGRTDYHLIVRSKLQQLGNFLQSHHRDLTFRVAVDTAPIPEKEWAVRAGLGTIGNHSLLIHPQMGTACFLGTLLLSKQWESIATPSVPQPTTQSGQSGKSCRQCNRCQESCPTGALLERKLLDARCCLNYWTIENRDKQTPTSIIESLDNRLIGCDLCQRVCPCNESVDLGKPIGLPLEQVERMTPEEFNRLFDQTPIQRVGLERLKRNAGNLRG